MLTSSSTQPIRVLCVDDHPLLRDGIAAILEAQNDITLVGEASNGVEAIALHRTLRPDVTLMDLQMPDMDGITAIEEICKEFPKALIVVLTTYDGDAQAVRALKAGASSYLLKGSLRHELLGAIRSVRKGQRHISPEVAQQIALHSAQDPLSLREVAVLELVARGNANKEIAWRLSLSEETVKAHLRNAFVKLGATDRTHAVTVALRRGLIALP
jgi:DNA-binding NarL/FixJ family response regulator